MMTLRPRKIDLVDDAFGYMQPEGLNEGAQKDGPYVCVNEFPEEQMKYQKLKDDASRLLYPSCSPEIQCYQQQLS
ncbi:hypothetical protein GIB67_032195 [Kingdonia uniflora]|uniref:Uncharacterized protein n=1 Tax=Kingdonia uniflora TaxID=39325 RepID=A0A7J7MXA7_9MAGN|nr:hypothetical protein GIB67_032195 [Kingdonia uniflora]